MKAILVKEAGELCWTDVDYPILTKEKVIIRVYAAALNRADLLQRKGAYPSPAGWPKWMGLEVSGVIEEMGEEAAKTSWKVGDKVCALLGGGGYAEYVAVPVDMIMPIPKGLSFDEAASLPEAYATCYLNLFIEGGYKPGETVYFPAGASGLASVGIPMAKAFGAYVITSVQNAEHKARIAHLGADVIVDTSCEDVVNVIAHEAKQGHPIDLAIDCLAGEVIGRTFPYVNEGCRWVLISTLAGIETRVPLRAVLTKGIQLKGSMLRKRSVEEKGSILHSLVKEIWPKLESGEIKVTVDRVFPITQAAEAHAVLERGENVGKVVLKVRE